MGAGQGTGRHARTHSTAAPGWCCSNSPCRTGSCQPPAVRRCASKLKAQATGPPDPLPPTPQAGWLRLNMGNIHLEQEQFAAAVKQYRMALDQLPPALKRLRLDAQRNIGIALLRAGRYQEAADAFGAVMAGGPDHQAAFNLLLCCWAQRDVEMMKQAFLQLVQVGGGAGPACFVGAGLAALQWQQRPRRQDSQLRCACRAADCFTEVEKVLEG